MLSSIPGKLLARPEELGADVAVLLALLPAVSLGIFFFRREALVLLGACLVAGLVSLLALEFMRVTVGLPSWARGSRLRPFTAGLLVASFLSPAAPLWLGAALVLLLVILDRFVWAPLGPVMVHPALVVFALLFLLRSRFPLHFVSPFDGNPWEDPLSLWYRLHAVVDPIKLYVGNVAGPMAATSSP